VDFGKEYSAEGVKMSTVKRLELWKRKYIEFTEVYDAFNKLTGAMPDCELMAPIFAIWEAYTESVSELVGDNYEWLKWYEYECDMGKEPKEALLSNNQWIEVKTIEDLAILIARTK